MSVLVRESRPKRRGAGRPSVREVCLLGVSPAQPGWSPGDRVALSGRVYRVETARGGPEARRYVHLSAPGAG